MTGVKIKGTHTNRSSSGDISISESMHHGTKRAAFLYTAWQDLVVFTRIHKLFTRIR